MKYVLSLDQGTTSSRAIVFDHDARVVASDQYEFPQLFPEPGWVEHDAEVIWRTQWKAIEGALAKAGIGWDSIEAIGITNQRETVVAWDAETNKPIGNAIVWQDRRTSAICDSLRESGKEKWIQERTGLLVDPYFSASKMRWILDNRTEAEDLLQSGSLRFGTIDSWLVWNLSAGYSHVTDVSNASRTQLMNLESCDWDAELLELFGVPEEILPTIVNSSGMLASTDAGVTGGREIPISGIAGDQQAALFGQLCFEPGMTKSTYGTGCFILMQIGETPIHSKNRLLTTVAWRMKGKVEYALEGSVFMGGASVQWLRDQLGIIEESKDVEALASQVSNSGDVVVVPAFTGLGAPHWDPYARGSIFGLTRGSSAAHIARATLEAIAFQVKDVVSAMESDVGGALKSLQADGGASANDLLMQIQANFCGVDVRCPKILETTALGAAFLAGLATGFWRSKEELADLVKSDRSFAPKMDKAQRERDWSLWHQAVERAKGWVR